MVILGERDEALGQVWHIPNPPTLTQRELLTLFFQEAGLQPQFRSLGKAMFFLAGLFIPAARETIEMLYEFEKPFTVNANKFIRVFGDISTPHQLAIKETLDWYRRYFS